MKKSEYNNQLSQYYQVLDYNYYAPYQELINQYAQLNQAALDKLKPLIEGINSRLNVNRSLPKTAPESTMEMDTDIQGGRKKSRSRDTLRPSKSRSKSRSRDTLRPSKSRTKSKRAKSKRAKSRAKSKRRY